MNKADQATVKGALEVRARTNTKMGSSEYEIPAGTIGYIIASRAGKDHIVYWTGLMPHYKGDHRTSIHVMGDLEPTGRRG
jgi:hypothetical protein